MPFFFFPHYSQYGNAMKYPMPLNNFRWLSREEIDAFNVDDWNENSPTGYYLTCHMRVPPDKQTPDLANFPPLPSQEKVTWSELSSQAKVAYRECYGAHHKSFKSVKLMTSFREQRYIYHFHTFFFFFFLRLSKFLKCILFIHLQVLHMPYKSNSNI